MGSYVNGRRYPADLRSYILFQIRSHVPVSKITKDYEFNFSLISPPISIITVQNQRRGMDKNPRFAENNPEYHADIRDLESDGFLPIGSQAGLPRASGPLPRRRIPGRLFEIDQLALAMEDYDAYDETIVQQDDAGDEAKDALSLEDESDKVSEEDDEADEVSSSDAGVGEFGSSSDIVAEMQSSKTIDFDELESAPDTTDLMQSSYDTVDEASPGYIGEILWVSGDSDDTVDEISDDVDEILEEILWVSGGSGVVVDEIYPE